MSPFSSFSPIAYNGAPPSPEAGFYIKRIKYVIKK